MPTAPSHVGDTQDRPAELLFAEAPSGDRLALDAAGPVLRYRLGSFSPDEGIPIEGRPSPVNPESLFRLDCSRVERVLWIEARASVGCGRRQRGHLGQRRRRSCRRRGNNGCGGRGRDWNGGCDGWDRNGGCGGNNGCCGNSGRGGHGRRRGQQRRRWTWRNRRRGGHGRRRGLLRHVRCRGHRLGRRMYEGG